MAQHNCDWNSRSLKIRIFPGYCCPAVEVGFGGAAGLEIEEVALAHTGSDNGRIADGGRYRIEPDGRVCWTRRGNITGCFQYYRAAGVLRVRTGSADIGSVTVEP